ncbi:MAG: 50S ribosomal protein L35 [Minisyncoccia bacterium]
MKNSVVSRIKITKKGKVLRRKMNIDHFRTRKSKKNILQKRKKHSIDLKVKKILNYNNRTNV